MTGRGFRCGNGEMGRNASVILPAEHRRVEAPTSCDKVSQRRPANIPARRRRPAPGGSLTLSSPTALLSSAPEWQAQFYKTKLCPFYVRDIPDALSAQQAAAQFGHNVGSASGVCMNRDNCRFAHSFEELRPLPDLRKTKLCSSYTKKTPCKNPKCPFAHSPNELRTSSSVFYKVTLCNFYKNGRCWNGSNCRFAHGNEELRSADQAPSDEDDELVSTTTTSTRTKKARRPCARDKSDGLLPTPAESTRLPYEKPLHKVRTAASTTSNSATTTPPGTAPQTQVPASSYSDTETLISLVTQKLLEPQLPADNGFDAPTESIPPGFSEAPLTPSSLNVDAETLMSFILAATNNPTDRDTYVPPNTGLYPSQSHYQTSRPASEPRSLYEPTEDTVLFPSTFAPRTTHSVLSNHMPEMVVPPPPPPPETFPVINGPARSFVPDGPDGADYDDNAEDPAVQLLIMTLLQNLSIDEPQPFV